MKFLLFDTEALACVRFAHVAFSPQSPGRGSGEDFYGEVFNVYVENTVV